MPVSTERLARFDRTLSRLLGLAGVLMVGYWWLVEYFERPGERVDAWLWGHALLALLFVALAAAPARFLTWRVLDALWLLIPALGVALQLTAFIASSDIGHSPDAEIWETTWMLTAVYLCLLALRCPGPGTASMERQLVRVNAFAAVLALTPALGFWLGHHHVPPIMLVLTVVQFMNVTYVMVFVLYRSRMVAHFALQERWERRARDATAAEARIRGERAQARHAHDHVLGALNGIALFGRQDAVALPPDVVSMAERALHLLDAQTSDSGDDLVAVEARRAIVDQARSLGVTDVTVNVATATPAGAPVVNLAADAVHAMREAMAEAIRNSNRHAPGHHVCVTGRIGAGTIEVSITDDGPGFEPESVPADRLGVKESVLRRMRDVPGGDARIDSAPGRGTSVLLHWEVPPHRADGRSAGPSVGEIA
ncbi:MAG: ATP-binding protein [Candidatus Microbacterium phytovorans]|uniref:ATP-binding protein n=1 Tax=Candidatus Microbacterium phytovorans TaxID=3121374 RepID=A0AAJ5W2N6_9MICO|nr:ATP-binding protein [Microbacterium sp.]WEK13442.1 MAG: ATP-binding protein [Microbacterium sp.]